eukprot:m.460471 g.460471  ORF g.460471 m.460471 type:complete len:89 (-) comp21595_c0_seq1:90-356(-)
MSTDLPSSRFIGKNTTIWLQLCSNTTAQPHHHHQQRNAAKVMHIAAVNFTRTSSCSEAWTNVNCYETGMEILQNFVSGLTMIQEDRVH